MGDARQDTCCAMLCEQGSDEPHCPKHRVKRVDWEQVTQDTTSIATNA